MARRRTSQSGPGGGRRNLRPGRRRLHAAFFLAIGLVVTGLMLAAYVGGVFKRYEFDTVDARFAIRGDHDPPSDIVIVKIDDKTFDDLQRRWPFPRKLHAKVIDNLWEADAKTIAFDIQFTEPTTPKQDQALLESVYNASPVVLTASEVDPKGRTNVLGGVGVQRQVDARVGSSLFVPTDPGGVIRRFSYQVDGLKTFAVITAETYLGRKIQWPEKYAWIDWIGPPATVTSLSFSDVLNGRFDPKLVRGKVVIVGPYSPVLQDIHVTPTVNNQLMAGVEVQANAVSTILRGFPLRSSSRLLDAVAIVLLGMFAPLVALRLSFFLTLALSVIAAGLFAIASQLAFNHGSVIAFTYPLGALILSTVGVLTVYFVLETFERQRVRDVFARFVPEGVVNEVLARAGGDLRLGGVKVEGTVMFTDLRGFTTFSEQREAEQVIEILNRYMSEMSEAILDHGGTLVSYLGDGILAVFGAPIEQPDHAQRALAAAREMVDVRLPRFNEWLDAQGHGVQFRMGIGLNSGFFMSGNVGSERRLEYTAIGDTANTASRIEGMTKEAGTMLLMSEDTKERLPEGADGLVFYDEVQIRGRQGTVKLWGLAERP